MGLLGIEGGGRWARFGFALRCVLLYLMFGLSASNVVLIGKNVSLSFNDIEASFTPDIKGSGECGVLHIAEPLDACTSLKNKLVEGSKSPFVLIRRGGCTFDDKVRAAQRARFKAAIVYNYEESDALVAMAGTSVGVSIHAVFVSKSSGEVLRKYAGRTDVELWIIPTFENSAWSIMAISFISLLAMAAVLATCFFVRRHRIRRERPRAPNIREFHGMSSRLVKAMPSLIFTSVLEDNCTSRTCTICLEDYNVGEQLRILPCRHKFHARCVDNWLTSWRTFCPICKQDARTSTSNPPPSESTPLLSSGPPMPSSSIAILSSFRSSPPQSPSSSIPIMPTPPRSPLTYSLSGAPPRFPHPRGPYANSPPTRSSVDIWNASSNRSHRASPHSIGAHLSSSSPMNSNSRYLSSPMNSRFLSAYIPSPAYASPSYHSGSSGRQSYLRHCNDSGTSLSALASAQSLPGC